MTNDPNPSPSKETKRLLLERRCGTRYPAHLEATCHTGGGKTGVEWPGRVRDISLKGIGLVINRSFSAGTLLTLKLPRGVTPERLRVVAQVRRVVAETGGYFHGCQFVGALTEAELNALLKQ